MTRWPRHMGVCVLMATTSMVTAQTPDEGPVLQWHGFATLGAEHTDTNFDGRFARDASQVPGAQGTQLRPDSRVGIQANWVLNPQVELVAQAVLKDRPHTAKSGDILEWAFASVRPSPDVNLRVGRMGMDLFLISDHHNVGYAYTPARPPVDFYGLLSVNPLDGIDVTRSWQTNDASWKLKGFTGRSSFDVDRRRGQFSNVSGLVLSRESGGLTVRGTLARGRLNLAAIPGYDLARNGLDQLSKLPFQPVAQQARDLLADFDLARIRARYTALGVSYDHQGWVLAAEWMRTQASSSIVQGQAAYVTVGHRWGSVLPYVGLSRSRSGTREPRSTPAWGQAQWLGETATGLFNSARIDQRTQTVGVRWDFANQASLKFQHDVVTVGSVGTGLWHGRSTGGRARVTSVILECVF